MIEHLQAKRAAERANVAAFSSVASLPILLVEDLAKPVTSLDGIRTLSHALEATS